MNRITALIALWTLALGLMAYAGDEPLPTFRGEISDSQCALNVHSLTRSHDEMLKSKSGAAGRTRASCSQYCIDTWEGNSCWPRKGTSIISTTRKCPALLLAKK